MSATKKQKVECSRLARLRNLMKDKNYVDSRIEAYIIPHCDAHMSEYIADCDKRLEYMTRFTGSAGMAIVTLKEALLWTDGRYHTQAEDQVNKQHWTVMKSGLLGTPTEKEWLIANLKSGSRIGHDPKLATYTHWLDWESELKQSGLKLVSIRTNLVDIAAQGEIPKHDPQPICLHPLEYSGESSTSKISKIKDKMNEKGADVLILSALDEIAWLLNLRGSDVDYNPVFFSYVIITPEAVHFFPTDIDYLPKELKDTQKDTSYPIVLHKYSELFDVIQTEILKKTKSYRKVWIPTSMNYYVYSLIPDGKRLTDCSPVQLLKAIKNQVEVDGMIRAHIKCATALCRLLCWLEKAVPNGDVTELTVSKKLEEFRGNEEKYMGPSFPTISGSGPNSAIIHYIPTEQSDRRLSTDEIYLCDSGCQFLDGTTDVTRTIHFGEPKAFEKECFTRVFKGQTSLGTAVFPEKLKGNYLDSFARRCLWEAGLDYPHGTSHGVGSYLHVHEGPQAVSWKNCPDDPGLSVNMMLSNEPGYYKQDDFGIRLENIVQVVKAEVPYVTSQHDQFLTFKTLTLVPIQTKLLDISMLTQKEISYLNAYHNEILTVIGPILQDRGYTETYDWLIEATKPIFS